MIEITFLGDNISPETFSNKKLFPLLESYTNALFEISKSKAPLAAEKADYAICRIEKGSYKVTVADLAECDMEQSHAELLTVIANDDYSVLRPAALENLQSLSAGLKKHNLVMEFFSNEGNVTLLPEKVPAALGTFEEMTTVYGELIAVGGKKPNIHLEIPGRKEQLICDVSRQQAHELAGKLYTTIGVYGTAVIEISTMKMTRFRVEKIIPYDPADRNSAINALRDIFSKIRTDDSPEEYFENLRNGEI